MKNLTRAFLVFLFAIGCDSKDVNIADVLTNLTLSSKTFFADGQSTISVTVQLSNKSSADRRSVIFKTTGGSFADGSKKVTAKAEYESGKLIAKTILRAPISPGDITISAQPEFDSPVMEFVVFQTVTAKKSKPASIKLESSAFAMASNFFSELKLSCLLKNANGGYVSKGYVVVFDDVLVAGGNANGRYRDVNTTSNDTSRVSIRYGASNLPIGTAIKLRATILDSLGNRTKMKDSVLVTINL